MRTTTVNRFMIRRGRHGNTLSLEEVATRGGLHPLLVARFVLVHDRLPIQDGEYGVEGAVMWR